MALKLSNTFIKNLVFYTTFGIFALMVCSLGITFALGANQMEITGQAYFSEQTGQNPDRLPMYPDDNGGAGYFTSSATGQQNIHIVNQSYENGDFYLSICTANSNSGNTNWYITFRFTNPTTYTWTNGAASIAPWPPASGGLNNNRFTFTSATILPTTLGTNQIAQVQLNMQSQLGKTDAQGAAIVTIKYDMPYGTSTITRDTRIFFKYYSRDSVECPL